MKEKCLSVRTTERFYCIFSHISSKICTFHKVLLSNEKYLKQSFRDKYLFVKSHSFLIGWIFIVLNWCTFLAMEFIIPRKKTILVNVFINNYYFLLKWYTFLFMNPNESLYYFTKYSDNNDLGLCWYLHWIVK